MHAAILLAGAGLIMTAGLGFHLLDNPPTAPDKARHYQIGRVLAAVAFYFTYAVIILRVLVAGRGQGSMTRRLLWLPAILALGIVLGLLGVFLLSIAKETVDFLGLGDVEWLDVDAGIDGALSMVFPIALIMALTPILIPLDLLLQMPRISRPHLHTGIDALDNYLQARESQGHLEKPAEVLLAEDDFVSATTVVNFCRDFGLKCHHVATAADADHYLRHHSHQLRLVVLDHFLHVDSTEDRTTGGQWLAQITRDFPIETRPFRIVIISGYPEYLGDADTLADLVLKKPWSTQTLADFVIQHGIAPPPPEPRASDASPPKPSRRHAAHRHRHAHGHHRLHRTGPATPDHRQRDDV
ncbi:MAG: hypothetical protein KJ072_08990 [Verrucomicrobia bacterium]|nr:hypothetical protein [Verrucomicrobiota bacterium]